MLKIHQLRKTFNNNLSVLKGVDLTLKRGEVMAVIGPSGTGKSTLLRCINFLDRPDSGIIEIDGIKVDASHVKNSEIYKLRRKTSMVFQNYNLFKNMTEN